MAWETIIEEWNGNITKERNKRGSPACEPGLVKARR